MLALSAFALITQGCSTAPRHEQANLGDWYKAQDESTDAQEKMPVEETETVAEVTPEKSKTEQMQTELDIYKNALNSLDNNEANPALVSTLKTKILAMEIKKADEAYNEAPDQTQVYAPVIRDLKIWLEKNPDHALTQSYKYQLARLLDITGQSTAAEETLTELQQTASTTSKNSEVQFRLAEAAFSQRDYDKAIGHYSNVLKDESSSSSDNRNKAIYMRGWSYLQVNEFKLAAQDFLTLLTNSNFSIDNQQMLDDTYRGFILSINDAGGVQEIPSLVSLDELQPIAMNLYKQLIEFYTSEERWSEVIMAYQAFQDHYPESPQAIEMELELLSFLEKKKQKASLREEKANFIERYADRAPEKTAIFTLELAEYNRAEALEYRKAEDKKQRDLADKSFAKSLEYYEFFLEKFADRPEFAVIKFNYAETQLEAGFIEEARKTLASLDTPAIPEATREKAAYLSITTLNDMIQEMSSNSMDVAKLEEEKYLLAENFVKNHPQHAKASSILSWLMIESFKQDNFKDALEFTAIAQQQFPALEYQATQIRADILFAQENWNEAAQTYEALLVMTPVNAEDAAKPEQKAIWRDNALKAYYQAARQEQNPQAAIALYAQVFDGARNHELAPAALYEAAILASTQADPVYKDKSIELLKRYIAQYKAGEQLRDAKIKLAEIYVKEENWALAAPLMQSVAGQIDDPSLKRTAVLEVADLYRKGGNATRAIKAYSSFITSADATTPYQDISKARMALIELYYDNGQKTQAYKEMNTFVNQDLNASEATKDTRNAALEYAILLANRQAKSYRRIRLTGNLQASFQRKQAELEKAIDAYKRLERFEGERAKQTVNAGIGDLFAHLSQSLLNAPIPSQLSELEQEEYMMIIEEQAFPFEEKALASHEKNVSELHNGQWSQAIQDSLSTLRQLMPARFDKQEQFEGAITHVE